MLLVTTGLATAQTTTTTTNKARHKKPAVSETTTTEQIETLKTQLRQQQEEIDALKGNVANRDEQVVNATQATSTAQQNAADATAKADQAAASAQDAQQQVKTLQTSVDDLKTTAQGVQETIVADQARVDSPASLHYKGVTITPVAFFAFEGVWRQRSVNSDVNTPFNSIPFPSAVQGHTSELNFSGRQSRLGGLFEANAGNFKLSGYAEMDFLGTGTSSNNNQSNSYVLRQRQIWGKAETASGFAVTGGQMWSLVTEDGLSTNVRTEKLPNTIDAQYLVGFSWARQPAIRFQQRFGDIKTGMFTAALSLEQAQITNFTVNGAGNAPADYFFAGPGQNGGLYNAAAGAGAGNAAPSAAITTYANNVAPDIIVKGAFDLPHAHFEFGGLARFLRDFYYPSTFNGTSYTYGTSYIADTKTAGGIFGSARVSTSKYLDVALQLMAGTGTGRYGSAQLADATLRPDGSLEPIKNYHGMLSLEGHPTPKLDVFAYYDGEYAQRTVYANAGGGLFGYGPRNLSNAGCYALPPAPATTSGSGGAIAAPSTCAAPTRYIQEPMFGWTYRLVNSPKYGRLQYSMTWSLLQRNLWSGTVTPAVANAPANTPTGPRAIDNMIHVGMRYYIP
jgi:hypothetical protein